MSKPLYNIARFIFSIGFKIYYKLEIQGKENVPEEGSLIIMANHITYLDPPLIGCILDRKIHFMAKEELFKNPILGFLLKKIGQFPVKRGKPDRSALKKSFDLLKNEKVLGIFPEGTTQGKNNKLSKAKAGAVLIPIKTEVPILPIGITFSKRKVKVSIGKPFTLDKYYNKKLSREERKEAGKFIMNKIREEINRK
ncbi:lysophospholipid acyltransferase family protein [Natronospora cellulosivora (SeqCode)]